MTNGDQNIDELYKDYKVEADRINTEVCKIWGIPYPLQNQHKKVSKAIGETLHRAVMAEFCLQKGIGWDMYQALRGPYTDAA